MSSQNSEQLRSLTSLRFFAAAVIVVAHTYPFKSIPPGYLHLGTGVTFFFVLSGFILTYTYLSALRTPSMRGIWNFYVARWARIYPVHWIALIAAIPYYYKDLFAGKYGEPFFNIFSNVALIQTFVLPKPARVLNAPSWSLSAEVFFYALFPFLIWGLTTRSLTRRVAVLLLALSPWLLALISLLQIVPIGTGYTTKFFYSFPPVRLGDFVAGILLGFLWHRSKTVELTFRQATLLEAATVLFLVGWAFLCVWLAPWGDESCTVTWSGAYYPPFLLCIWVFGGGRGLFSKVLSTGPFVYLGEISFGVYMFHLPLFEYLVSTEYGVKLYTWSFQKLGSVGPPLTVMLLTVFVSAVCYNFYEMPLRGWLRRKLSIRKVVPPENAAYGPTVAQDNTGSQTRRAA